MSDGYLLTANTLAKMTGFSPQHINRVFKQLYFAGLVAFTVQKHQGVTGGKRYWCAVKEVEYHGDMKFVMPEYVQPELPMNYGIKEDWQND
jgi:DNA-binding transcriptional regulator YhcF (GntR family)